jgi:hypothetical protein
MKPSVVVGLGPHQIVGGLTGFMTGGGSGAGTGVTGPIDCGDPEETGEGVTALQDNKNPKTTRTHIRKTKPPNLLFILLSTLLFPLQSSLRGGQEIVPSRIYFVYIYYFTVESSMKWDVQTPIFFRG